MNGGLSVTRPGVDDLAGNVGQTKVVALFPNGYLREVASYESEESITAGERKSRFFPNPKVIEFRR